MSIFLDDWSSAALSSVSLNSIRDAVAREYTKLRLGAMPCRSVFRNHFAQSGLVAWSLASDRDIHLLVIPALACENARREALKDLHSPCSQRTKVDRSSLVTFAFVGNCMPPIAAIPSSRSLQERLA